MIDIAGHFGDNLARCRRRADLSQEELSVRASALAPEEQRAEHGVGDQQRDRRPHPDQRADFDDHPELDDRDDDEDPKKDRRNGFSPRRFVGGIVMSKDARAAFLAGSRVTTAPCG